MMNKTIPLTMQGMRLDVALAALFPEYSRSMLTAALKKGYIEVNQKLVKPKDKVKGNEEVTLDAGFFTVKEVENCQPENIPLAIVYEDADLLVVNKPANFVVHPGRGNLKHTLVNGLIYYKEGLANLPRAGIIHRLDQNTTGLLLVAKTHAAYNALIKAMKAREIKRHYYALVQGVVLRPNICQTFYGRSLQNRLKMAVKRSGKEAITLYKPYKNFAHFTLVDIELMTGRTHQIRVHMQYLKHPIVGDPLYGQAYHLPSEANLALVTALNNFTRQALHAYKLVFAHPINKKEVNLSIDLPSDMQLLLNKVEQYDI
ncbi:MAG: hypothetical protein A3F18_00480 [Legionellales bacterium RIFCSPHIGHO2_12_FULL_37_14]|nr:MAG: hypothetical protein A3F18_00480 [Legionellales bacterium RIFCSPHIGHO2_12_FULL_37_14]